MSTIEMPNQLTWTFKGKPIKGFLHVNIFQNENGHIQYSLETSQTGLFDRTPLEDSTLLSSLLTFSGNILQHALGIAKYLKKEGFSQVSEWKWASR